MEMIKSDGLTEQQIKIEKMIRKDKAGCPILKGQKGHKITFIDDVMEGKSVHNIVMVECWKQFNFPSNEQEVAEECCQLL